MKAKRSHFLPLVLACCLGANASPPATADGDTPIGGISEMDRATIRSLDSSRFFTLDGKTRFYTGRNIHARTLQQLLRDFDKAAAAGEKVVRMHLLVGRYPNRERGEWRAFMKGGAPSKTFLESWDRIFEEAAERGLHVNPVFDTHGAWQADPDHSMDAFHRNIFAMFGGPAKSRSDIIDSVEMQAHYVRFFEQLTHHFSRHANIFAWEAYTELNVSFRSLKAPQQRAAIRKLAPLMERVASAIRRSDPLNRPVFTSLAQRSRNGVDVSEWEDAIIGNPVISDIASVHSYPTFRLGDGDLTGNTLIQAGRVAKYGRLYYIGECDLALVDEAKLLLTPGSEIAYRRSLWSAMTHGLSVGGMWWWHDRFADGDSPREREFTQNMQGMCKPLNDFVREIDFEGMKVIPLSDLGDAKGSAIGNAHTLIGYLWNPECKFRDGERSWIAEAPVRTSLVFPDPRVPSEEGSATISFYSADQLDLVARSRLDRSEDGSLRVDAPPFTIDMVFKVDFR